jgi:8-oxo-dGTP diphosphatase
MNFCPLCGHPLADRPMYGKIHRVCDECGFVHFWDPVVAAVVLVVQNGHLLMVRRAVEPETGKWALPAGYIDYDENPREAAVREVLEETGLDVRIIRVIDVLGRDRTRGAKASIVLLFEGEITGGVLSAQDDVSEAAFFAPEEIPTDELAAFESLSFLLGRWNIDT